MDHEVQFQRRIRGRPVRLTTRVADGTSLWDAARALGLPVAASCSGSALCARCGFVILAGHDSLSAETGTEREARQRGSVDDAQRLSCQTRVHGDVVATTTYW